MIIPVSGPDIGDLDSDATAAGKTKYDRAKVIQYGINWHYDNLGRDAYTVRFQWIWGYMRTITIVPDPDQPEETEDVSVFTKGKLDKSPPIVLTGEALQEVDNIVAVAGETFRNLAARTVYTYIVNHATELPGADRLDSGTVEEAT